MTSGVKCSSECTAVYLALKNKRVYRYIVFKVDRGHTEDIVPEFMNEDRAIEFTLSQKGVEVNNKTRSGVTSLISYLRDSSQNEPRYIVFNFAFVSEDRIQEKVIFILWSPESSSVKHKMLYSSSKDALRKCVCNDITVDLHYDELEDLGWDSMLKDVKYQLHL
ncbi:hypothetical protein LOD99_515 [Oopsacas minuta]|uniref:ADF-H domain-containing protein n=1 Tax=Oopsacas minuta TaxID=111878 RepID=A0AAV7K8Z3_9METZ|nr:hypothetical protein LOD99_515 [Oopsacas minuta]